MTSYLAPPLAQMMPGGWTMHDWYPLWGTWHMLIWLLVLIALMVVAWAFLQKLAADSSGGPPHNRALELLSERYAKGEIDREEYLKRR